MANTTKRRGFNPILAFLLGFLFGIIVLIGSVAGAVYFALNYKLDKLEFNKTTDDDGNTKYIYVNANEAETVLDLFMKITELTSDDELSIGKVENLLPITSSLTDAVYGALSSYVDLDIQVLRNTPFSGLGSYLKDAVMEIRPAVLLDSFGGGGLTDNKLVEIVLYGKEADYVEDDGVLYPVYYDCFTEREIDGKICYVREGDEETVLPEKFEQYLYEKNGEHRLYIYQKDAYYVAERTTGGKYLPVNARYDYYNKSTTACTGNYYYENGEKVEISPVTLGTLADGSALSSLDEVAVTDFIGESDDLTEKVLGDVTVGDLLNGDVDFEKIINDIEICSFMDIAVPTKDNKNAIMIFLAYSVTDLAEIEGEYSYTGTYHYNDGQTQECFVKAEDGLISGVFFEDGKQADKVKISEVSDQVTSLTGTLKLKDIIEVEGNKILEAIGNATIDTLSDEINSLSINELYADNIYCAEEGGQAELYADEEYHAEYLYYVETPEGFKLVNAGTDNAGKLDEDAFAEGVYYTYGAPTAMWKLLLYKAVGEDNENKVKTEMAYSVNNITAMIENVQSNTHNTSMRELHEAGIMVFENEEDLNVKIDGEEKTIGDMTLDELVGAYVDFIKAMNKNGSDD